MRGSYILVIEMRRPTSIGIGSLGNLYFDRGYYCYVGSAMGKGRSLETRISRHLIGEKKLRWHVDYLLSSKESEIVLILCFKGKRRMECELARKLSRFASSFVPKFGSSDCKCKSHLFYFSDHYKLCDALASLSTARAKIAMTGKTEGLRRIRMV